MGREDDRVGGALAARFHISIERAGPNEIEWALAPFVAIVEHQAAAKIAREIERRHEGIEPRSRGDDDVRADRAHAAASLVEEREHIHDPAVEAGREAPARRQVRRACRPDAYFGVDLIAQAAAGLASRAACGQAQAGNPPAMLARVLHPGMGAVDAAGDPRRQRRRQDQKMTLGDAARAATERGARHHGAPEAVGADGIRKAARLAVKPSLLRALARDLVDHSSAGLGHDRPPA